MIFFCFLGWVASCLEVEGQIRFKLFNSHYEPRLEEVVVLTRGQYLARAEYLPEYMVPQAYDSASQPIPTQVDDLDGDGIWDELAFLVSLGPRQTASYRMGLLSPELAPAFPQRTRGWLAPFVKTTDTTGEYRAVLWARIRVDSTRSVFAQFQMGAVVFENLEKAYVFSLEGQPTNWVYKVHSPRPGVVGPPLLYSLSGSENGPLIGSNMRGGNMIHKFWLVSDGPARSLGYAWVNNENEQVLIEIHPHRFFYRSLHSTQSRKNHERPIQVIGF